MTEVTQGPSLDHGDVAITRIAAANTIGRLQREGRQLIEQLHALAKQWDANAARNQRNGQSLLNQGDGYAGGEGLAVAEALGACVVDLRALLADYEPAEPEAEAGQQS